MDGVEQRRRHLPAPAGRARRLRLQAGGWRVDRHPRFLADLTGDGRADIVGFGDAGVWTALSNGDGTFQAPKFVLADLGFEAGGWRVEKHPRFLADITGDGRADIVGFGDAGVWTALSNGDGTFQAPKFVARRLRLRRRRLAGREAPALPRRHHRRRPGRHRRVRRRRRVDGAEQRRRHVPGAAGSCVADFGFDAGGWRVEKHPRFLADLTGDGRADIVGFGDAGVWTALSNGDGTFQAPKFVVADFGFEAGGWRVEKHPRFLADITGDGRADIVGFGDAGVWMALSNGDGTFQAPQVRASPTSATRPAAGGWRSTRASSPTSPATAGPTSSGSAMPGSMWRSANADGVFAAPARFVLPNFGYGLTVLAIARSDREIEDAGIWRSTDGGGTWSLVHSLPASGRAPARGRPTGLGAGHRTSRLRRRREFTGGQPGRRGDLADRHTPNRPDQRVSSPCASQSRGGRCHARRDPASAGRLCAGQQHDPGLARWRRDLDPRCRRAAEPDRGRRRPGQRATTSASWSSRRARRSRCSSRATRTQPRTCRSCGAVISATSHRRWRRHGRSCRSRTVGEQDSGNVWLAITRPGQGEALFYGPQRFFGDNIGEAWVGPLDPQSASDWHQLDTTRQGPRRPPRPVPVSRFPRRVRRTAGTWRRRGPYGC